MDTFGLSPSPFIEFGMSSLVCSEPGISWDTRGPFLIPELRQLTAATAHSCHGSAICSLNATLRSAYKLAQLLAASRCFF
jgi:hypothetical protein